MKFHLPIGGSADIRPVGRISTVSIRGCGIWYDGFFSKQGNIEKMH